MGLGSSIFSRASLSLTAMQGLPSQVPHSRGWVNGKTGLRAMRFHLLPSAAARMAFLCAAIPLPA